MVIFFCTKHNSHSTISIIHPADSHLSLAQQQRSLPTLHSKPTTRSLSVGRSGRVSEVRKVEQSSVVLRYRNHKEYLPVHSVIIIFGLIASSGIRSASTESSVPHQISPTR